jgi:hypothetical protein
MSQNVPMSKECLEEFEEWLKQYGSKFPNIAETVAKRIAEEKK